ADVVQRVAGTARRLIGPAPVRPPESISAIALRRDLDSVVRFHWLRSAGGQCGQEKIFGSVRAAAPLWARSLVRCEYLEMVTRSSPAGRVSDTAWHPA